MSSSVSEGGTATAAMWRNLISTQAIPFVGVGSAGEDIYQVRAENGSAEVRLDLLEDGRIRSVAAGAGVTNAYPLPLTSLASREGNIPLRASQGTRPACTRSASELPDRAPRTRRHLRHTAKTRRPTHASVT